MDLIDLICRGRGVVGFVDSCRVFGPRIFADETNTNCR